ASPAPGWLVRRAARSGPPTGQRLRLAPFTGAEVAVFGSWDAGISGIAHGSPPIIVVHRSRYLWCVCFAKVTMIMMFPLVRQSCRPRGTLKQPLASKTAGCRHHPQLSGGIAGAATS